MVKRSPPSTLCTLPEEVSFERLVDTVKMRWRIERDYLELKQELGLGHYEGRNWRGIPSSCELVYRRLRLFDARTTVGL